MQWHKIIFGNFSLELESQTASSYQDASQGCRDQFIYFTGYSFLMGKNYSRGTKTILIGSAKLSVSKTTVWSVSSKC